MAVINFFLQAVRPENAVKAVRIIECAGIRTMLNTENAKLNITPEPDSILRVFMVYQPLENPILVEEPILQPMKRQGFTVVEWGGTRIA